MLITGAVTAVTGITGFFITAKSNRENANTIRKASEILMGISLLFLAYAIANENLRITCNTNPTFLTCIVFRFGSSLIWGTTAVGILAISYTLLKKNIFSKDKSICDSLKKSGC